jgi:hypothetical protein
LDYLIFLRRASLNVAKEILAQVAEEGLFKKQHLYITFSLQHPSVKISSILREEFKDEMTIVLQHEFWDLKIDDYGFSVNLAFEHSNETLYVPFSSMKSISDPSEDFCLNFVPNFSDVKSEQGDFPTSPTKGKIISFDTLKKEK